MDTEVLKINPEKPESKKLSKAAQIIIQGGLVAFPTETVYGIASRVTKDSLKRLDELKNRKPDKYYSLHIGYKQQVNRYVPSVPLRAKKLIENCWPGPLTIVFRLNEYDLERKKKDLHKDLFRNLYKGGSIGIRCPENRIASALLSSIEGPVVAPSANVAAQPPAVNPEQVIENFSGKVEMIIDGGICKYKKSSTVVKVNRGNIDIIRKGAYSPEKINELSRIQFLFVCTGNTCRSPMAEGMLKKHLSEKIGCKVDELEKMGYKVISAGMLNLKGAPASFESITACVDRNIDISSHKSRSLTLDLILKSDFIYGMSHEHCERIIHMCPEASEKCSLLAPGRNIPDPIGQPQQVYDKCADLIEEAVKNRLSEMQL